MITPPVSARRSCSERTPERTVNKLKYPALPLAELVVMVEAIPAVVVAVPSGLKDLKRRRDPVEVAAVALARYRVSCKVPEELLKKVAMLVEETVKAPPTESVEEAFRAPATCKPALTEEDA